MTKFNGKSNMGYCYYHDEDTPGAYRLDININEVPSGKHFDPFVVYLPVKDNQNRVERLAIRHPWTFEKTYQACMGLVEMVDGKGGKEEAYTFGGSLVIDTQGTRTTCVLESPAPILEISAANPTRMMFIEEIEILIAQRKAALLKESRDYEVHLVNADPLDLYMACVKALVNKFENFSHKEDPNLLKFINLLHDEEKRLKDESYAFDLTPDLEEIL